MHKSFPRVVNELLHAWQLDQLLALIPPAVELRLLDVGCGYGRLAHAIVRHRPHVQVVGLDLAHHYAWLFARNGHLGGAVQAQALQIPLATETFDLVIATSVLEFMPPSSTLQQALKEMLRVLKLDGQCVLITEEPAGRWIWSLGGVLSALRRWMGRGKELESPVFTPLPLDTLKDHIAAAGGTILQQKGCPMLTLALPALILLSWLSLRGARTLAHICLHLDRRFGERPRPSIYTVSVIAKAR